MFIIGLALVIYFAEKLVKGVVGTSIGFGISAFLISVIFIGFDPENLAVGAVGSVEGVSGIALGAIIGAAMVAMALAFGITALFVPLKFEQVAKRILAIPILSGLLLAFLAVDGKLTRIDGGILLFGYIISVLYLIFLSKRGMDIKPSGEVSEVLEEEKNLSRWKSFGILIVSLIAIVAGSEMLVIGSKTIIGKLGLTDTVFGMTILAFLVSIEEVARELPAAMKGRSEITFGNVVGSILAFFLFNAGIIALISPIGVNPITINFYLPVAIITLIVVTLFMLMKKIPRWAGLILVILYIVFVLKGYVGI
jgi:cation:H+ antiporter